MLSSDAQQARLHLQWLISAIAAETPRWDIMDFHPMEKDGDHYSLLMQTLHNADMSVHSYFCSGNWYLKVALRNKPDIPPYHPSETTI